MQFHLTCPQSLTIHCSIFLVSHHSLAISYTIHSVVLRFYLALYTPNIMCDPVAMSGVAVEAPYVSYGDLHCSRC